jgi:hypothetical protein
MPLPHLLSCALCHHSLSCGADHVSTVQSSVIREVEYDASAQVLYITFVSGKTYAYDRVSADLHDALLAASSKGEFFNRHIRGHHPYSLVTLSRPRRRR